jgi:type IV pilus assembly protein PilO
VNKLSRFRAEGLAWIRARAADIKRQYKAADRTRRTPKSSERWWQKDLRILLADVGRMRLSANPGVTLQSITDISRWTSGFRITILILIYVFGVFLATLMISAERISDVRTQNSEREVLKSRYIRYAEQVDLLPVYRAQTETILERFGALLDAIPASLESIHVLSQLNKAATDTGLQLELFKPLPEEMHTYYVVLPIEIRLRGDYNAIASFIEQVSKMQHLVTVDVVILASATHENQIVLASLLKAYRYKDLPPKMDSKVSRAAP